MRQETVICVPDISEHVGREGQVIIDFLLPNGMFIQLNVDFHKPLDLLKQTLWESAKTFPLFDKLKGKDNYLFEYLNRNGEKEEVNDETLRLSEIRPMGKFLRLHERKKDEQNQTMDRKISTLLGSKIVMEMHAMPRQEVDDFRNRMTKFAEKKVPIQHNLQLFFETRHPVQLRCSPNIPENISKRLSKTGHLMLLVKVKEVHGTTAKYTLQHHVEDHPEFVIDTALRKLYNQSMRRSYDHVLKVIGKEEYLYGKTPLCQFKYVYDCLQCNRSPEFWLVSKKDVMGMDEPPKNRVLPQPPRNGQSSIHRDICIWQIDDKFQLEIKSIQNIEITSAEMRDNIDKVKLVVGLYHGSEVLGDVKQTPEMTVSNGNCNIDPNLSKLTFDLAVKDMQTASRLCFTLHGKMRGTKGLNIISWINIPVFDFLSRLLVGEHKFIMWPVTTEIQVDETGCYPLGTIALNPHGTIALTVHFSDYNKRPPFVYPDQRMIMECAAQNMEKPGSVGSADWRPDKANLAILDDILKRHHVASDDLHEQDKENIWNMRYECRDKRPDALPLVLKSVNWQNHKDVAKMQVLLTTWKQKIELDHALELLDFNFPDKTVRKYAVDCLQDLSDEQISLYLLQLVQALKYEMYLYCPLAEFLVERAVKNPHTGHQLFWHLKSELHNPLVMVRFALLLEAYLRACPEHLAVLYKQYEALCKLNSVSQLVKAEKRINDKSGKEKAKANMRTVLDQKTFQDRLAGIFSPLSPLYKLGPLRVQSCKFMDSKKRPLYLVWSNDDEDGNEIHIIYKNGDDLRQDMLTLQMLHVMDSIWQSVDLDLRLSVYGCVATGFEQGMIEVVRYAETISSIQIKQNRGQDKRVLFDWLKEKNKTEAQLDNAIEEFILSCAGYTVATYVLGIADRHNDNIMLKENGQLFHIDFGHFLGNFKKKYGFKRERVPVVFTNHFEYVITKGDTNKENYKKFQDYCNQAYLALRNNGALLIRLFMMMLSSGIPQLTSISDLSYLKETLALNLTDDEAVRQLNNKLNVSLNSYSTIINWKVHNIVHK